MQKFVGDVLTIGEWIIGCTKEVQIRNAENHYRQVVSKQFYPKIDNDSILDSLDHLNQMTKLQIKEITKHYENHNS